MKKLYLCPQIVFEPLEDEDLLISPSKTQTTSFWNDPSEEKYNSPGFGGDGSAQIVIDPTNPDEESDY